MATNTGPCPKCNTPNEYTETLCNMCGQRLPWASVAQAAQSTVPVTPAPTAPAQTRVAAFTPKAKTPPNPDTVATIQKTSTGCCLGCLGIVFLAVLSPMACPRNDADHQREDAYFMCKIAIKNQLKDPNGAVFPDDTDPGVHISCAETNCVVNGYVDATNGFNAHVRTSWTASTNGVGDAMRVTSAEINE